MRGETIEMIAKAEDRTMVRYKLATAGFDKATAWAEQAKRQLADQFRAGKCKEDRLRLFGLDF
jgi:hypothetical protein